MGRHIQIGGATHRRLGNTFESTFDGQTLIIKAGGDLEARAGDYIVSSPDQAYIMVPIKGISGLTLEINNQVLTITAKKAMEARAGDYIVSKPAMSYIKIPLNRWDSTLVEQQLSNITQIFQKMWGLDK
jgi:hypothetical protein